MLGLGREGMKQVACVENDTQSGDFSNFSNEKKTNERLEKRK